MNTTTHTHARTSFGRQHGFGLVELMVSLILGLLVAGSAVAIFASNRQTYAAAESLGRIQENARIAYELMARDLREAGGNPCAKTIPVANVATGAAWWQTLGGGVIGYENGTLAGSLAGTDAIQVMAGNDSPVTIVSHSPSAGTFTANVTTTGLSANDLLEVCDYRQASIFQTNNVTNAVISYAKSGLNCTKDLTFPTDCASGSNGVQYANDAILARLHAVQWYVASNGRGGNSLYQAQLRNNGVVAAQEIAEGVNDMQLTYLLNGATSYVNATSVGAANWLNVTAVRISLTMQGGEGQQFVSTTGGALTRRLDHVVTIRNHTL